jgi:hypothetical protein
MKYNEIEKCVAFNTEEIIFMPNEIFEELKNNISNTQQLTFAYSYLYLITYLYRHCKYYNVGDIDGNKIKEILGYSSNTRSINPIIKKGGLLDQMELTSTEKDFPTEWHFDSFSGDLVFDMLSEFDEDYQVIIKEGLSRKFTVKKPIRSFHRYPHDVEAKKMYDEQEYEDGTFFEFENTHQVPFEVFMFCMDNDKIGCTGFYLYSYLKRMNDFYFGGYDCPVEKLSEETGIPTRTLTNYLDVLKKYHMVECTINQKHFVLGLPQEERKANTYETMEFELFNDKPIPYEKIKVKSRADYYEEQKEKFKHIWGSKCDIPLEDLPY